MFIRPILQNRELEEWEEMMLRLEIGSGDETTELWEQLCAFKPPICVETTKLDNTEINTLPQAKVA